MEHNVATNTASNYCLDDEAVRVSFSAYSQGWIEALIGPANARLTKESTPSTHSGYPYPAMECLGYLPIDSEEVVAKTCSGYGSKPCRRCACLVDADIN